MSVIVDAYCRVSTVEQAQEGYSIGEQEARLRAFVDAHGWILHDCILDGGFSGGKLERPGIQKVISDAKAKRINKVVVYKLDRLSRSQKDTLFLIEDVFMANGVDFVSMTESLDTSTPLGIAMIGILSVFAQLEREQIKERMSLGRDASVRLGKWKAQTNGIIGFDYSKENGLVVNEYDAAIVRSVFEMYVSGKSVASIAKVLTEMNFRGHEWLANKVTRIINQPMYIGKQRWKGDIVDVEGIPHLISDELWEAKEKEYSRRNHKASNPQRAGEHVTMFGGMTWCGCCGGRICSERTTEWSGEKIYRLYCISRRKRTHGYKAPPCDNIGWKDSDLVHYVLEELKKLNTDRPLNYSDEEDTSTSGELNALRERLHELESQEERLVSLFAIGTISADLIAKKSEAIVKEREGINARIESLTKPTGKLTEREYKNAISSFRELVCIAEENNNYKILSPIVRQLIQSVTINKEEIYIKWNF